MTAPDVDARGRPAASKAGGMVYRLTAVDTSIRLAMMVVLGRVAVAYSFEFAHHVGVSDWVGQARD